MADSLFVICLDWFEQQLGVVRWQRRPAPASDFAIRRWGLCDGGPIIIIVAFPAKLGHRLFRISTFLTLITCRISNKREENVQIHNC